ncbi:MAG: putative two-component system sensor kinase [Friedmanniella sp.]|nr:putative two-component system sensor kinase [Friedmanniella sp.]
MQAAGRRWLAVDLGLGVLLGAAGFTDGLSTSGFPHPSAGVSWLMALAGAAQSLRRARPLPALTLSMAAMSTVAVVYGHFESGSSLLITLSATYSAVVYGRNLPFVVAAVVGFAAALNLAQPVEEAVADLVFTLVFSGLAVAAGLAVRTLRGRAALSAVRTAVLEDEVDTAAREAAERERTLLARELHDILAHGLGVIMLQAGAAEHALESDPERARAAIGSVRDTAREAIGELQALVRTVRAEAADHREPQPTLADLPRLADQVSTNGFAVSFSVDGEPRAVPVAIQASVYRVAQEGLTNAIKHSGAATCQVQLGYRPHDVEIAVLDDGVDSHRGQGSRAGLIGVCERVSVFGGAVRFGPRSGGGWALVAAFPTSR